MAQAIWQGTVLADSKDIVEVEGNAYFPPESLTKQYFKDSSTTTVCPWKGTASYYSLDVEGKQNPDAAWYYASPKDAAKQIKGRVAFWRGVQVTK